MTTKLEQKKKKQAALALEIRMLEKKQANRAHADDTRRKVLTGAALMQAATKDHALAERIRSELQIFLVRNNDRALFGLALADESKK